MNKRFIFTNVLFFLTIYLLASPATAVMKGLSTEELTRTSELTMTGEVESVESQWSKDGTTIFTNVSVLIDEVVRGKILQRRITVEYEGGEIGDIGLKVSDVVPMERGEKVLLFLKSGKSKKEGIVYNIIGKGQGKYSIGNDGIARKRGFTLVNGEEAADNNIPVDVLIEKIRRVK